MLIALSTWSYIIRDCSKAAVNLVDGFESYDHAPPVMLMQPQTAFIRVPIFQELFLGSDTNNITRSEFFRLYGSGYIQDSDEVDAYVPSFLKDSNVSITSCGSSVVMSSAVSSSSSSLATASSSGRRIWICVAFVGLQFGCTVISEEKATSQMSIHSCGTSIFESEDEVIVMTTTYAGAMKKVKVKVTSKPLATRALCHGEDVEICVRSFGVHGPPTVPGSTIWLSYVSSEFIKAIRIKAVAPEASEGWATFNPEYGMPSDEYRKCVKNEDGTSHCAIGLIKCDCQDPRSKQKTYTYLIRYAIDNDTGEFRYVVKGVVAKGLVTDLPFTGPENGKYGRVPNLSCLSRGDSLSDACWSLSVINHSYHIRTLTSLAFSNSRFRRFAMFDDCLVVTSHGSMRVPEGAKNLNVLGRDAETREFVRCRFDARRRNKEASTATIAEGQRRAGMYTGPTRRQK
jgi:hypothetical protein